MRRQPLQLRLRQGCGDDLYRQEIRLIHIRANSVVALSLEKFSNRRRRISSSYAYVELATRAATGGKWTGVGVATAAVAANSACRPYFNLEKSSDRRRPDGAARLKHLFRPSDARRRTHRGREGRPGTPPPPKGSFSYYGRPPGERASARANLWLSCVLDIAQLRPLAGFPVKVGRRTCTTLGGGENNDNIIL